MTRWGARGRGLARTLGLAWERLRAPGGDRLAYIGGEGVGNLGDDAMFLAARKLLAPARLISRAPAERERRLSAIGLAGESYFRGAVLGGGTLINPMWRRAVEEAAAQRLPLWTFGTGVGSCGFAQGPQVELDGWRPLLEGFRSLGVRGPRSEAALHRLGLTRARAVGDPALALCRDAAPEPADPPRFALNLFLPAGESAADPMEEALAEAAGGRVARGWEPVPIALHETDLPALRRVLERLGRETEGDLVAASPEAFFRRVAPCTVLLGVRLHSAVLACCCGVPPLLVGYRDKCFDFMESMELGAWCVPLGSPEELAPRLRSLVRQAPKMRSTVLRRAQRWKAELFAYAREIQGAGETP